MKTRRQGAIQKSLFGIRIQPREDPKCPRLFCFTASAKDLVNWVGIRRITHSPSGTQRLLADSRMRAITRYLSSYSTNCIPNSILLAFLPQATRFRRLRVEGVPRLDLGFLEFSYVPTDNPESPDRPALVVDGQHRLYGISEFEREDVPVFVTSILDADPLEQAFQFIVINNKSVRVPTDNVKAIVVGQVDEQKLTKRLVAAGIKYGEVAPTLKDIDNLAESPFKGLLDWPANRHGRRLVPLTAIEQMLKYLEVKFHFLSEDEATHLELFFGIWKCVRDSYEEIWGHGNMLMKKVCLSALNEFISDKLHDAFLNEYVDIYEREQVSEFVDKLLKKIPDAFWKAEWKIPPQDNAKYKLIVIDALNGCAENMRTKEPWSKGIPLFAV